MQYLDGKPHGGGVKVVENPVYISKFYYSSSSSSPRESLTQTKICKAMTTRSNAKHFIKVLFI